MNTKGYTLIEVTLFLSITAVLGASAFIGLGPRLRNVRFTSAIKTLQSSFNRQFTVASSGDNPRTGNFSCNLSTAIVTHPAISNTNSVPGSSEDCVINGKLAVFGPDQVTYYSLVSLRECTIPGLAPSALDLNGLLSCYYPRIVSNTSPTPTATKYDYGLKASWSDPNFTAGNKFAFGYLQDPNGTATQYFLYKKSSQIGFAEVLTAADVTQDSSPHTLCTALSGRKAALMFMTDRQIPDVKFDTTGLCP